MEQIREGLQQRAAARQRAAAKARSSGPTVKPKVFDNLGEVLRSPAESSRARSAEVVKPRIIKPPERRVAGGKSGPNQAAEAPAPPRQRPTIEEIRRRIGQRLQADPKAGESGDSDTAGSILRRRFDEAPRPERFDRAETPRLFADDERRNSRAGRRPEVIATPEPEPLKPRRSDNGKPSAFGAIRGLFGEGANRGADSLNRNARGTPAKAAPASSGRGRMTFADLRRRIEDRNRRGQVEAGSRLDGMIDGPRAGTSASRAARSRAALAPPMKLDRPDELARRWLAGQGREIRTALARRVQQGEYRQRVEGAVARNIQLQEQLELRAGGDIARRLGLAKPAWRATADLAPQSYPTAGGLNRITNSTNITNITNNVTNLAFQVNYPHRGRLAPSYRQRVFRHWYYGPRYFGYHCWYPHWSSWVRWTYTYHCPVVWDPRPVWCRPVCYEPAAVWVWWECPEWVGLPTVASGTWVDVQPVDVGPQLDLQLLAIRFVDPGHPEEDLGPRYRLWLRNNSEVAIETPFSVMLLASADEPLQARLPQAGVEVTAIEAGETQSVDIRLPLEATTMSADEAGDPLPFAWLHAIVDAHRTIDEADETNNGTRLARDEVLPVDPAAFELDPSEAPGGSEVIVAGEGFGPEPGKVLLHLGGIEMECVVLGWYDLGVKLQLPALPLSGPTVAELIVVRGADGAAANPLQLVVQPDR
jgi:hypothetical protein